MMWLVVLKGVMTRAEADAATGAELMEAMAAITIYEKREKARWQEIVYGPWRK